MIRARTVVSEVLNAIGAERSVNDACVVKCADGADYVTKIPRHRQFENELLGHAVATRLELPVADCAAISISADVIESSPLLRSRSYKPGEHFGSLCMPECDAFPAKFDLLREISEYDLAALYSVYAFDELIHNNDRKSTDLLRSNAGCGTSRFQVVLIDHGHAFTGPDWTCAILAKQQIKTFCHHEDWIFRGLRDLETGRIAAQNIAQQISQRPSIFADSIEEVRAFRPFSPEDAKGMQVFLESRGAIIEQLVAVCLGRCLTPGSGQPC